MPQLPVFTAGGLILLDHEFDDADRDCHSGLDFLPASRLPELISEDIYSWGDFSFADYGGNAFPRIPPDEVAELLYFRHAARPLRRARVASIANRFLCYVHDDGWRLRVHYTDWEDVERCLAVAAPVLSPALLERVRKDETSALWVSEGRAETEERTDDLDLILSRRS
jgi:hypothetical protein